MFKKIRILILLFILATVALGTWRAKHQSTEWDEPLRVVIYPINGDGSEASKAYIASLDVDMFAPIEQFMEEEAARYSMTIKQPVSVRLGPVIDEQPPAPPADRAAWKVALWSLQLRYWAYRHNPYAGAAPHIRLYVLYHDPATQPVLAHSLGLEKGLIGVIHAFAARSMTSRNNVVIAHEMLHTLGATDKYDLATGQPIYPDGYAEPEKEPRLPQQFAEIMGGKIPVTETRAEMPSSLKRALIGPKTAGEINWRK